MYNILSPDNFMYRTIDHNNNILETWRTRDEVRPQVDYHRIQYVTTDNPVSVISEWQSMFEFLDIPS